MTLLLESLTSQLKKSFVVELHGGLCMALASLEDSDLNINSANQPIMTRVVSDAFFIMPISLRP
jgi:hypothetical protein